MMDRQEMYAFTIGIVFAVVGALGFIPVLTPNNMLLGIFAVMGLHSIVHVAIGVLGIALAFTSLARLFNLVIGAVYLLLGIIGFIPGMVMNQMGQMGQMNQMMLLGLIHINVADNLLHVVVGLTSLAVGLWLVSPQGSTSANANRAPIGSEAWQMAERRSGR